MKDMITFRILIGVFVFIILGCGTDSVDREVNPINSAQFVSADPPSGNLLHPEGTITVSFDGTPHGLRVIPEEMEVIVSGETATISGNFPIGELQLVMRWQTEKHTLVYTVQEPEQEPTDGKIKIVTEQEPEQELTDGKIKIVTDATFNTSVLQADLPVVLKFTADWCAFCRQMFPIVTSVANENREIIFATLDIDNNRATIGKYNVRGIPTYIIFRDGQQVRRFSGAMPKEVFVTIIMNALE